MKINIFYFSGTGNTKKVAETLKLELEQLDVSVNMYNIEKHPVYTTCDRIVIAYPVWGFSSPKLVADFVKTLPEDVVKAYFVKTSGEPLSINDASSLGLARTLSKKGYKVSGEYHFIMPYNMVFRHSDGLASKMLRVAKERLKVTALDVKTGSYAPIKYPLKARFMRALCSVEHIGLKLNGNLFTVNKKTCINCNKCVKNCPANNVSIHNGRIVFSNSCIGCARCFFNCPTDAIKIGLLNFMKVNGPYDFSADESTAVIPKYCNKSYKKYFNVEN